MRSALERAVAMGMLIITSPLLLAIATAILFQDGRPVLFCQIRVGRNGKLFDLLKFRSMSNRTEGPHITASGDRRVTRAGRFLRKYKLDELPQLWNVVRGEMNLIGPRPEVPRFVQMEDATWREVLRVRPGITDLATLVYRDEERLLAQFSDPEQGYRDTVLPAKLALNLEYLRKRSLFRDVRLLTLTVRFSLFPGAFDSVKVKRAILS